jgi:hypothetical protein
VVRDRGVALDDGVRRFRTFENQQRTQGTGLLRLAKPFFRLPVAALHSQTEAGPGNPGLRAIPHYLPTAIAAQ